MIQSYDSSYNLKPQSYFRSFYAVALELFYIVYLWYCIDGYPTWHLWRRRFDKIGSWFCSTTDNRKPTYRQEPRWSGSSDSTIQNSNITTTNRHPLLLQNSNKPSLVAFSCTIQNKVMNCTFNNQLVNVWPGGVRTNGDSQTILLFSHRWVVLTSAAVVEMSVRLWRQWVKLSWAKPIKELGKRWTMVRYVPVRNRPAGSTAWAQNQQQGCTAPNWNKRSDEGDNYYSAVLISWYRTIMFTVRVNQKPWFHRDWLLRGVLTAKQHRQIS